MSLTYDDRPLELWMFMDVFAFQEFIEELFEPVDCCIACYSSAHNDTVESLLNTWLPLFYEYFPNKPAIVCEVIDCDDHENNIWPPNWQEVFTNVTCQLEISVFEKSGLRSLFDEVLSSCDASDRRRRSYEKRSSCKVM
uniref:Uncharacterized protein n=1 Tax=Parascaris univalens TaxID=6257 RepID=A0A914ZYB6_PARUN